MGMSLRTVILLRTPPGVGKTRLIANALPGMFPETGITYLAPTIQLLEEAASGFKHPSGREPCVLLGLEHSGCPPERRDQIRNYMRRGLPYYPRICETCPLLECCRFHETRRRAQGEPIVFATIQLATQHPEFWRRYARDVVVFDEDSYDQLLQPFEIGEGDIARLRRVAEVLDGATAEKYRTVIERIDEALKARTDLAKKDLWREVDWRERDTEIYEERLPAVKLNALNVLPALRGMRWHGQPMRYREGKLRGWRWIQLPKDKLYVVLDATADPDIVGRTLKAKVEVIEIKGTIRRITKVIQNRSHSYSKHSLGAEGARAALVVNVVRYLEDCRRHRRWPALVVRGSMTEGWDRRSVNDDFELLRELTRAGYEPVVIDEKTPRKELDGLTVPVVTFGRERGFNLLLDLGVTDIMVIGVLAPRPLDVVDRARALFDLAEHDDELMRRAWVEHTERTRLGYEDTWGVLEYVEPDVQRVYRHMAVARVVQAAERIRSLMDLRGRARFREKRIFLETRESVSDYLWPDWIGPDDKRDAQWLSERDEGPGPG